MQVKTATIIGSSGMTGSTLYNLLSHDNSIESIRLIVRHAVSKTTANTDVRLIDFEDTTAFKNAIAGSDAVFCTIGTTQKSVKGDKALYRKIDYDIPVNAARYCRETGCKKFIVVSAVGANSKSSNFYLRLKGEMEEVVKSRGPETVHIMQPSMLLGHRNEKRTGEAIFQRLVKGVSFLLKGGLRKYRGVAVEDLAKAMIAAAKSNTAGVFVHQYPQFIRLANNF
ncbi:NAD(P)H-binding protein [Ferruginibacter paludis]|uniref:NAD(P)H-binding protein n=1 Tax=Ferruginibacter paludis TaxID=1310417 RepID=UPI0025B4DF5B|nr:NAD(P)H-binding protein [Ferruginibacter paludis]MDN3656315.1 NAD(P)H-binding protein [Ferruginibacter paludis]